MLYDNALLILAYCAAYKISGNEVFLDTAKKAAVYVLRDLTGAKGNSSPPRMRTAMGKRGNFISGKKKKSIVFWGRKGDGVSAPISALQSKGTLKAKIFLIFYMEVKSSIILKGKRNFYTPTARPISRFIWTIKF